MEHFNSDFIGLASIGAIGSFLCIFKIFLFKKINNKLRKKFTNKAVEEFINNDICLIDSVRQEKNFVLNDANIINSHIIFKKLYKNYFSIMNMKKKIILKDINFSLRKDEVLLK